jgi:ferredoxin-NADP reductase
VQPGDRLDVRGPIGGWLVWKGMKPALLVGGGSGVVPFLAMLRHARYLHRTDLLRIAVSSRTLVDLPYAMELMDAGALIVLTREPYGDRAAARLMAEELRALWEPEQTAYVCGSARFAEAASQLLVDIGVPDHGIRVERFGPSGS